MSSLPFPVIRPSLITSFITPASPIQTPPSCQTTTSPATVALSAITTPANIKMLTTWLPLASRHTKLYTHAACPSLHAGQAGTLHARINHGLWGRFCVVPSLKRVWRCKAPNPLFLLQSAYFIRMVFGKDCGNQISQDDGNYQVRHCVVAAWRELLGGIRNYMKHASP